MTSRNVQNLNCTDDMTCDTIQMPVNTVGSIYVNNGSNTVALAVGTDGLVLTANSADMSGLGLGWKAKPSGGGLSSQATEMYLSSYETVSGTITYSTVCFLSVQGWNNDFCEGVPLAYSGTIENFSVALSDNGVWSIASGQTLTFTIGTYIGRGDKTYTSGTGAFSFIPKTGAGVTTIVSDTSNNTRDVFTTACNISVAAGEGIAIQVDDSGTGSNHLLTGNLWIRSNFT